MKPSRAENVAEAQRLRAEGMLLREVAAEMGVPMKTAHTWLYDPDLSKQRARRTRYRGQCVDCGAQTDGSGGFGNAPQRCASCSALYQHDQRFWTREAIVGAIQGWVDEHGDPPTASDWFCDRSSGYPAVSTVLNECGTWNAAILAAGFEPFGPGQYGRGGEDNDLCLEVRGRYEAGESVRELASAYGCSRSAIEYRIGKAGGPIGRSRLAAA